MLVDDARRDATLSVLDDHGVDYAVIEEAGERAESTLIHFPLPTEAVDEVLDALREEANIDESAYTVVSQAETATTENIDSLQRQYAESTEEADDTLPVEELTTEARSLNPNRRVYLAMTLFSTVIATAGLLRNSAAAVVGAMVIAPFFGTALSVTTGACCGERRMLVDGLKSQTVGVVLAIVGAAVSAAVFRQFGLVPPGMSLTHSNQFALFMAPNLLSVAVGVAAGAAGAFALATSLPVTLAGVAVAAAITPSAAALGISLAWRDPVLAMGAFVMLSVNVCAVNLAGIGVFAYLGYRPSIALRSPSPSVDGLLRTAGAAFVVLFVVATVVLTGQQVAYNRTVNDVVQRAVDEREGLELAAVSTRFNSGPAFARSNVVTVTAVKTSDREFAGLDGTIERRVTARTGREVNVRTKFVTVEGTTPTTDRRDETGKDLERPPPIAAHGSGAADRRGLVRAARLPVDRLGRVA